MDLRLRPYKGKRPQLGKRVYVDPCATLVGDIEAGRRCSNEMNRQFTISPGSGTTLTSYIEEVE